MIGASTPTPSPDTSPKAVDVNYFREYPSQGSTNDTGVGNFDTTPPADAASKTADGISSRVYSSPQSTDLKRQCQSMILPTQPMSRLPLVGLPRHCCCRERGELDVSAAAPDVTTVTSDVASSCPVGISLSSVSVCLSLPSSLCLSLSMSLYLSLFLCLPLSL